VWFDLKVCIGRAKDGAENLKKVGCFMPIKPYFLMFKKNAIYHFVLG